MAKDEAKKKTESVEINFTDRIKSIQREISIMYHDGLNMQDIRRKINALVTQAASEISDVDDKKEFSRKIRESFDRYKQFAEACYTEVLVATRSL